MNMRRFRIEAEIETTDDYKSGDIRVQIDRDLNRGDGIYLDIKGATIRCVAHEPDEDDTANKKVRV